jgi:maltooligosyltrehalose synthase
MRAAGCGGVGVLAEGTTEIADLGGEAAYENLRDRAAAAGIRLASDMVPNHMGIDSTG